MAVDLTQVQSRIAERLRSEVAEQARQGVGGPDDAARFAELMDGPGAAPDASATAASAPDAAAASPPRVEAAATVGDRILANMSPNAVHAPTGAAPAADATAPADLMALQAEVVELKTTTAVAVGAVHKTTQGVDTLLKAQ